MRDFRASIQDAMDSGEAAGYAGQMVRCGITDEALFERIKKIGKSPIDPNNPYAMLSNLHFAIAIDLGVVGKIPLSPNVEDELDQIDLAICAARFLGMKKEAEGLELVTTKSIGIMYEYYSRSKLQNWVSYYSDLVGVKNPEDVPILRAILEARKKADERLRKVEGINPVEFGNSNRVFWRSFASKSIN